MMNNNEPITIKADELNIDTYPIFCKMYLIQQINDYIQPNMILTYLDVSKLINSIIDVYFLNLSTNSGILLLSNKLYQTFMCVNMQLDRQFLFGLVSHIAQYSKVEYVKENISGMPKPRYKYEWKDK